MKDAGPKGVNWVEYFQVLKEHFTGNFYPNSLAELINLKQTGSVREYQNCFNLLYPKTNIPEEQELIFFFEWLEGRNINSCPYVSSCHFVASPGSHEATGSHIYGLGTEDEQRSTATVFVSSSRTVGASTSPQTVATTAIIP